MIDLCILRFYAETGGKNATIVTAMGLAREREVGTLEQVMVTPIRPLWLLAGKMTPFVAIGFFDVLLLLARNAGRVLSRDAILERLRRESREPFDRSIDVHISRIRAVIEDDPKKPRRLRTVRGVGYQFARLPEDGS